MAKKSLAITDAQKYGHDDMIMPPGGHEGEKKRKERKTVPTVELHAHQLKAFGIHKMKIGDKGKATVHFALKSAGDPHGSEVPAKKKLDRASIALTHVENGEGPENDDKDEVTDGEEPEAPDEAVAEPKQERVSPAEAAL